MDSLHTSHSSVVGIPSKSAWSTTAVWRFESGELFAALSFWGDENAPHEGRRLVGALSQAEEDVTPAGMYQRIQQLAGNIKAPTQFSGAFLWIAGSSVVVICLGQARVALQRGQAWRWIVSGQHAEQVLQGNLRSGDVFLLLTAAGEPLTPITQSYTGDAELVASMLIPMVQRLDNQAEVAAQVIEVSAGKAGAEEELQTEPSLGTPALSSVSRSPEPVQLPPSAHTPPPAPAASSFSFPDTEPGAHLISPARLSQGIEAAQVVRPHRGRVPRWWRFFRWERKVSWPSISLLRIGLVFLVIVAVFGTLFGVRAWRVRTERELVILPLIEAVQQVSSYEPDQRFAQRDAAQSLLERLRATKVSFRANQQVVQDLTTQVQSLYDQTAAETNLVNLPVFFDFRLVESNFLATRASTDRDIAVFLDPSQNKGLQMDLTSKRTEQVDLSQVSGSRDVAISGTSVFWNSEQTVSRTALSGSDATVLHTWGQDRDPQLIERFGTNVYIMDNASQQLWRLDTQSPASPSAWIRSARGVNLSNISSLTIDGEIWLGSREGDIYRLALGERQDFAIHGLQEPVASTVLLATSVDGTTLAVVEPTRQRIIFVNKETGEYLRQIRSPQIGAITDVFWGSGENHLYLVAGSVLYRVE